jgi:hypothetical protein
MCIPPRSQSSESSTPGISSIPCWEAALRGFGDPVEGVVVGESDRSRPMVAASSTSSVGLSDPSDAVEWVWRSIGTAETLVAARCASLDPATHVWDELVGVGRCGLCVAPIRAILMPLALAAVLALPAVPASADAVDAAVNGSRSGALPIRVPRRRARQLAAARRRQRGAVAHVSLAGLTSVCSAAGEIVGAGPSVRLIFDLFLQSPSASAAAVVFGVDGDGHRRQ